MKRPRVLLDCDGVLSMFVESMLQLVNARLGTSHTLDDVTEFDFAKALGLSAKDAAAIKRSIGEAPLFAAELGVYPNATNGVAALESISDVYIVTSPWNSNPTWTYDREGWLKRHFGIPHARVIHTSAKYVCAGDVLVDDKTSALVEWSKHHPSGLAVQWITPHNRRDDWTGHSTGDWAQLVNWVAERE